jgi:hypothetical protein
MELDLQSLFGAPCAQLYSLVETPHSPHPPHLGSYTRELLVSQDRRHLFVTPWIQVFQGLYPLPVSDSTNGLFPPVFYVTVLKS